jgi:hypothetical protein
MPAAWFVWAGWHSAGAFASAEAAVVWCKRRANDHRAKVELQLLQPDVWRYVGPRGRRHGVRLVSYIGTRASLDAFGVQVVTPIDATAEATR